MILSVLFVQAALPFSGLALSQERPDAMLTMSNGEINAASTPPWLAGNKAPRAVSQSGLAPWSPWGFG